MPRKGHNHKRDVLADPLYNNKIVTKLINNVMLDGKKGTAQKIVYGAFEIVEKCQFHFEKREIEMPYFEIPEGYDEAAYFDYLTKQGFDKRFNGRPEHSSQEYKERLDYELSIIKRMGYVDYYLIVRLLS